MNQYRNTEKDIHERIYKFIINCFRDVVNKISKSPANTPIISQLSSSLTSMGANDQEADAAGSNKDFISKYQIVKKETKETRYWLKFVKDSKLINPIIVDPYFTESGEILLVVSKIILNSKGKKF